jgi:hypothetical protein
MKPIRISFVPLSEIRFGQVGDYREEADHIWFKIAETADPEDAFSILVHELREKFVNMKLGIPDDAVDEWDRMHPECSDPGWLPGCPYGRGHSEGDVLERTAVALSGKTWQEYEHNLDALFDEP